MDAKDISDNMSSQSPHQYHGYEKAVYNKSLKTAYADLLMEKMSRANSMAAGSAADNMEDFEMGMIEDGDDDENNSYYKKFKRSILNDAELGESLGTQNVVDKDVHGDAWLDDNSTLDQDYSSEADKSFYEDDEEDEDREKDGESIVATDEDSEYYDDYRDDGNDEEEWSSSSKRMILIALFFFGATMYRAALQCSYAVNFRSIICEKRVYYACLAKADQPSL